MLDKPLGEEFLPDVQPEPPVRPFSLVLSLVEWEQGWLSPTVTELQASINPSLSLLFRWETSLPPPPVTSERDAGRGHDVTARRAAPQCGQWVLRSPARTSGHICAHLRAHLGIPAHICAPLRHGSVRADGRAAVSTARASPAVAVPRGVRPLLGYGQREGEAEQKLSVGAGNLGRNGGVNIFAVKR